MYATLASALALIAVTAPLAAADDCAAPTGPVNLFAASYSGVIHSLKLENGAITELSSTTDCGKAGSWLELDAAKRLLYCSSESAEVETNIVQFKAGTDGKLEKTISGSVVKGGVSTQLLNDGTAIAIAHYGPQPGFSVSTIGADAITQVAYDNLTLQAGSNVFPDRQTRPYGHQVLLDPTGNFLFGADLGADLIRIYKHDKAANTITQVSEIKQTPGSGPRHAIFWTPGAAAATWTAESGKPLFYTVIHELDNSLVTYQISYSNADTVESKEVDRTNTYGGAALPVGSVGSEVQVSPDFRFLIAANRLDRSFNVPKFDPANSTEIPSDSLAVFNLGDDGKLGFVNKYAAGGVNPRHFSLNKAGNMLAVGFMADNSLVVLQRDVQTGALGTPVAAKYDISDPAFVVFDEQVEAAPATKKLFRFLRN